MRPPDSAERHSSEGGPGTRRRTAVACDNCKRRKERCDGLNPCMRCAERGVRAECCYATRTKRADGKRVGKRNAARSFPDANTVSQTGMGQQDSGNTPQDLMEEQAPASSPLEHSRLIRDRKGRYMFIGDSANLYFLQIIRRVAEESVGSCAFVDDPLRYLMVEASPEGHPDWLNPSSQCAAPQIFLPDAQYLVKRYLLATNCVLDLFDESELLEHLPAWVDGESTERAIPSSIYYLVLAIGCQTSPENRDSSAEILFTYGRYLTAQSFMEDASMRTVQSYALISMYLLGASRRNAAFMHLGIAVRAAYAIGLHLKEVAMSFSSDEFTARERLWKVLRILDLFMSASLGRPPSTAETRDTQSEQDYSASTDLCAIFERILTDVYSQRKISTETLSNIGAHHRRWASRFFTGLSMDRIDPSDHLEDDSMPNIGLLHVKEAYYWTIILLTRPFLTESVTLHARQAKALSNEAPKPCTYADTGNKVLVHACVDSAMRTVDLLNLLSGCEGLPKRLPFVINSLFIAGLVLGFAYFGDLYQTFPLDRYLTKAHELLAQFAHDAIAQRNASIIAYLHEACDAYFEKRTSQSMDHQSIAVGVMFGQIHRQRSQGPTRPQSPTTRLNRTPELGSARVQRLEVNSGGNDPFTRADQTQGVPNLSDHPNLLTIFDDFANMPYPTMTPRTLWFDEYDVNMPLFSTIRNTNLYYPQDLNRSNI